MRKREWERKRENDLGEGVGALQLQSYSSSCVLVWPCAFFSMFLVTRPLSFCLKKKKKKKSGCQNQTKKIFVRRRDRRREGGGGGGATLPCCTCRLVVEWTLSSRLIARRRDKTFSCCVVWWKKTIRSTSHTIRYSKSMMLYIHAHSSKIWANFNAFLRWSGGSLQRASLVTENQKPLCLLLKSPNMDSAEGNEVLLW